MVEELVLQAAEEAFASRVVRAAALLRHGPGQAVSLAYADPAGPSVMASPVRVADRALARGERPTRPPGSRWRAPRSGAFDPPCHDETVVAVDDRAEYAFSSLGSLNSVMSVSHSLFGASAWKLRSTRLGARPISPLVGVVAPLPLQVATLQPSSAISLRTTFSLTTTPPSRSSLCTYR